MSIKKITNWVWDSSQYSHKAKKKFTDTNQADPWLIIHAKLYKYIVVTLEAEKRKGCIYLYQRFVKNLK